jgi:phosphomannomutase
LWELGAEVVAIGVAPNGKNINHRVGSTAPQTLSETVVASGAAIGIALDGDADRLIVVDEHGRVVDGEGEELVSPLRHVVLRRNQGLLQVVLDRGVPGHHG